MAMTKKEQAKMAMTKKEQAEVERLLTVSALRYTSEVLPDLDPPNPNTGRYDALVKGFLYNIHSMRVEPSCTSFGFHSFGRNDKTSSQGARSLYSKASLAAKAMRHDIEKESATRLRAVDKMVAALEFEEKKNQVITDDMV